MRHNPTVCFIAGAGHSGSTLLGLALGAHPRIFYAGEARKSIFLGDENKPLRKRMCKVCGLDCPIWSGLKLDGEVDLYEALSRRSGRPVVVDSTKSIPWLETQTAMLDARKVSLVLVLLGRDGRAVLASGLRKYPDISAAEHARKWRAQMEATERFAQTFPGVVLRERYELFVTDPEASLRRLVEPLGVAFDSAMLDPFVAEHHPLGGNAGTQSLLTRAQTQPGGSLPISGAKRAYYGGHPRAFVLDERWRTELSAEALAAFEAEAGETNRAYAWERPGRIEGSTVTASSGLTSRPEPSAVKEAARPDQARIEGAVSSARRPKVFGLGLSRTGTRSLTEALRVLGWNVVHYPVDRETLETLVRGDVRFPHLERYDGITDITAAPFYEDLDRAYPGSKFVLTVRDEASWLRSCQNHWADRPAFQPLPRAKDGAAIVSTEEHEVHMEIRRFLRAAVYASYDFHEERFLRAYRRHVEGVTRYFASRPGDLLVLAITAGEGYEKLAPFLGVPIPSQPFPHKGRKLGERMAALAKARNEAAGKPFARLDEDE